MSESGSSGGVAFLVAAEIAKTGGEAALEKLIGKVQLIGVPPVSPTDADGEEEWSFMTQAVTHVDASIRFGSDVTRTVIFPLRKARSGPFADTILIGRASTSDVVIDHSSVSKLHARIKLGSNSTYTIGDAGSRNGTWLGTKRIADKELALPLGAQIKVGDWQLKLSRLDQTLTLLLAA